MLYNFVNIEAITRAAILINFIGISFVAVLFEVYLNFAIVELFLLVLQVLNKLNMVNLICCLYNYAFQVGCL